METELLEMAAHWRSTALEMIAKSEPASRSEMVNQMLMACAQMLEWKIKSKTTRALCRNSAVEFGWR